MKLYFRNSRHEKRFMTDVANNEEAMKEIKKFLDKHNYKSYYTRIWDKDGYRWFDVGSHSEFFIIDLEGETNE